MLIVPFLKSFVLSLSWKGEIVNYPKWALFNALLSLSFFTMHGFSCFACSTKRTLFSLFYMFCCSKPNSNPTPPSWSRKYQLVTQISTLKKINHIPYVTYAHGQHSQILWHNRSCWPLFVLNNAYYKGCSMSSFGKVVIFHDKSFLINFFLQCGMFATILQFNVHCQWICVLLFYNFSYACIIAPMLFFENIIAFLGKLLQLGECMVDW